MMQLEMPSEGVCPLCRIETVMFQENKSGNPYFQCHTFNSIVNLRPGEDNEEAETVLSQCVEADEPDAVGYVLNESDGEEAEDNDDEQDNAVEGQSLNDLLNQGDDDA